MSVLSLNRELRVLALVLTFKLGVFPRLSRHSADPHPCFHHHVNGTSCEPSSPCLDLRALLLVKHHKHQSYLYHAAKLIFVGVQPVQVNLP